MKLKSAPAPAAARRGLPEGSRCEMCGLFGPRSHMGWSSVSFDPADEFHQRLVKDLPVPFKLALHPGARLGFWAHVNGHGCDAENESTTPK